MYIYRNRTKYHIGPDCAGRVYYDPLNDTIIWRIALKMQEASPFMLITVISLYYARAFLTTKLHILCKRIQNLQKSFFLNGTIGEFNYIYKSFLNVFCASNLPLHVVHILTFIQNIEFSFFFLFSLKFKVFNVPRGRTDLLHSATTGRNFSNDRIYCTDTCTSELIAISADEICVSFTCFFVFVCLFFFSPPPPPPPSVPMGVQQFICR